MCFFPIYTDPESNSLFLLLYSSKLQIKKSTISAGFCGGQSYIVWVVDFWMERRRESNPWWWQAYQDVGVPVKHYIEPQWLVLLP